MLRSSRALVLLAVLLWQAMAMLGSMTVSQRAGELEHLVVHGMEESHHHHADHALHMEDGDASAQHLHPDGGNNSAGLLSTEWPPRARVRSMSPPEIASTIWLSPSLDGLLRPPMRHA